MPFNVIDVHVAMVVEILQGTVNETGCLKKLLVDEIFKYIKLFKFIEIIPKLYIFCALKMYTRQFNK